MDETFYTCRRVEKKTEKMFLKILAILLLQKLCVSEYLVCQFHNGTSCPKVVCPNTTLNFICNIETQQLGHTIWLLPNGTCRENIYPDRIALLQPMYAGCNPSSSSQHGTCGPFSAQTVATSGCVNSSLSVIATQQLNGAEVKCMNYDGHNYSPVGNATISVVAPPSTPNISVMSTCTEIEVQWSVSSSKDNLTTVMISAKLGLQDIEVANESTIWNTGSLTFYNLISNSFYTITYEASNCAGSSEASTGIWTLPRPPQDIHADHVISGTSTTYLEVTWAPVNNTLTYLMKISSAEDYITDVSVLLDHCSNTCHVAIVLTTANTTNYFVSMASVSGSRVGPFSDPVKSVSKEQSKESILSPWFALAVLPVVLLAVAICCACFAQHKLTKASFADLYRSKQGSIELQSNLSYMISSNRGGNLL